MNKKELLEELKAEGFSKIILNAFSNVHREDFVSEEYKEHAYENEPLPIGYGATISQPYTIAFMLELMELDKLVPLTRPELNPPTHPNENISNLKKDESRVVLNGHTEVAGRSKSISRKEGSQKAQKLGVNNKIKILEIGSGSGYVLALIDEICKNSEITGVEIIKELAERSEKVLADRKNIKVVCGSGSEGLSRKKFDRILISASAKEVPDNFIKMLNEKGVLVCVVGNSIVKIKKVGQKVEVSEFPGFIFVPLIS